MTGKNLFRNQIVFTILCSVAVTYAVIFSYRAGLLGWADNYLYDLNVVWRGPVATSDRVTLVLMDEESAVSLKRHRGQWSRQKLAVALDNLCGAGATVIGLDMVMSAPDVEAEEDLHLARSISECNNVVLARVSAAKGVDEIAALDLFQEGMIGDGFIDVPLDKDGILRKIRFFNAKPLADGSLQLLPAFALELSRVFFDLDFDFDFSQEKYFLMGSKAGKQIRLPYPDLLINYYGDYTSFRVISFAEAVSNTFDPDIVKDRVILMGSTLSSQKDFFTTPFSRFDRKDSELAGKFGSVDDKILGSDEPGVACHAHAVETILNKAFINIVDESSVIWLIVVLSLVGLVFYVPQINMVLGGGLLAAGLLVTLPVSSYLFTTQTIRLDTAPLLSVFLVQFIVGITLQKSFDRKKNAMITSLFGKYVSTGVVNELIKGDIDTTLAGRRENLTMLFSDLRDFTTISEKLGARYTGQLLNVYFDTMIPPVFEHKGTLDKLMGDAIMAFFGAPLPVPDHPVEAAATALLMMEKLQELKLRTDVAGAEDLDIGIGINTGEVTVGNLGSNDFMDYTIIGDAVNLASRLEGLNKIYGTHILCTEFTVAELGKRFAIRELDIVKVKGKEKAVRIFELAGWQDRFEPAMLAMFSLFEKGLVFYRKKQWDQAEQLFKQLLISNPGDKSTLLYLKRIAHLRQNPPQPDWGGVTSFDHK
ncbi:MAG: adenylate/guanylate cyclase domain-containing protein [Thermodesulfobacteriota bacterium]